MDTARIINTHLRGNRTPAAAFSAYKPILLELAEFHTVMEIGAGRHALFSRDEIAAKSIDYVANDINPGELSALPNGITSLVFDASGEFPLECEGKFDLIFSRMVQEHISGTRRFYSNMARMLRPGGVALQFHSVLYALPFVINRLIPETLSDPLLYWLQPNRTHEKNPKFPALYDHCRVSAGVRERLRQQGFREVYQIPFYGHGYYKKFPVVREIHGAATDLIRNLDLTGLASFCYTVAQK